MSAGNHSDSLQEHRAFLTAKPSQQPNTDVLNSGYLLDSPRELLEVSSSGT